ncbi:MAG TPA: alpha/beta hydrolase [Pyrinomonadaceae bacterium]|nr:alpha/beta hydrolase [Pyrinomonadaceae bacterium]
MNPYPFPVVFVPGIMGSELRDEYPVSPQTVWSPFKLAIKAYQRITPHPDNTRLELIEPARVVKDQIFEIAYSEFMEELRHNLTPQADQPVPVFPFAYDWRQGLEGAQNALADFIDEVIDRTRLLRHYHDAGYGTDNFPARVNLAGHSMGGMIIAGYLQANGDAKVNKIATIASPFRGSIEAIANVAIGNSMLSPTGGSSREREAARVTPSLYYLLPSFAGDVVAEAGLSDDLFAASSWQPKIIETLASFISIYGLDPTNPRPQALQLLTNMLNAAKQHRSRLEQIKLSDSKRWLCIVGVGANTRVRMQIRRDQDGNPQFDLTDDDVENEYGNSDPTKAVCTGDHTVPYLGARSSFIPVNEIVCVTPGDFSLSEFKDKLLAKASFHPFITTLDLVQRLVVSHFKDQMYGKVWGRPAPDLPAGVAWDPPIPGLPPKH